MNNDASLPGAASAQSPQDSDNPLGVAGLEFVEFSSPDPARIEPRAIVVPREPSQKSTR